MFGIVTADMNTERVTMTSYNFADEVRGSTDLVAGLPCATGSQTNTACRLPAR